MSEERLLRIEEKIDRLTEVTVTLARVESKIQDLETRRSEAYERVNRLSASIDDVDERVTSLGARMDLMSKILLGIGLAIVTAMIDNIGVGM
jgi:chromosome segregation ATPase